MAVRVGYGIAPHAVVREGFGHRLHFSWASVVCRGGIHLGSIYLRDSEGITEENLLILQEAAVAIKQLRGPWVLGGDWNLTPDTLRATNWLSLVGGVVVAPMAPTCNGSVYDCFVVPGPGRNGGHLRRPSAPRSRHAFIA